VEKALGHHDRAAELMREWIAEQREQGEWLRLAMGLSNLAYVQQAQGKWSEAQACLEEGLALCEARDLAMPRPALLANLAHNHTMSGRLDDAERVCAHLLEESRRKALADVEATALNQRVRVAILRADWPLARARLAEAAARAATLGIEYVALDCVLSHAKVLCGEGRAAEAAPLLRGLLARPDLEPVDPRRGRGLPGGAAGGVAGRGRAARSRQRAAAAPRGRGDRRRLRRSLETAARAARGTARNARSLALLHLPERQCARPTKTPARDSTASKEPGR
jgi:tetratricopeptide (TPR) repeat protein